MSKNPLLGEHGSIARGTQARGLSRRRPGQVEPETEAPRPTAEAEAPAPAPKPKRAAKPRAAATTATPTTSAPPRDAPRKTAATDVGEGTPAPRMLNSRIPAGLHARWQERLEDLGLPRGNAVAAALRAQLAGDDTTLIAAWRSERKEPKDSASQSLSARIPSDLHDTWTTRLDDIGLQSRTEMLRAAIRNALTLGDDELVLAVLSERRRPA